MFIERLRKIKKVAKSHILNPPFIVSGNLRRHISELQKYIGFSKKDHFRDQEFWAARARLLAHSLDKGLHARPASKDRGIRIFRMTVEAIDKCGASEDALDQSLAWCIDRKSRYESLQETGKGLPGTPFVQPDAMQIWARYEDLMIQIKNRRSSRHFVDKVIPENLLEKLVEAARWAPCSCNRQTIKIYITDNPDLAKKCHITCQGKSCFGDFIPCFVSFCVDTRPYTLPDEFGLLFIDTSLGAENFVLAANALGIGTTTMAWGMQSEKDELDLRTLLCIQDYEKIIFNCVLGFSDFLPEPPLRKPLEKFYKIIR